MLQQRVDIGDHRQRFGSVKRCALRELNIDIERICPGQLEIQTPAGLNGLLAVGHLVCESIARLKLGVTDGQRGNHEQADQGIEPGACDHPYCDPATESAQHIQCGIHVSDRATNSASLRMRSTPSNGTPIKTATRATATATSPASPKVRMRSDDENCKAI